MARGLLIILCYAAASAAGLDGCSDGGKSCGEGFHLDGDECVENTSCAPGRCNEDNGGGTCDDSAGYPECSCSFGYRGENCEECMDGFVDRDGRCVEVVETTCEPAPGDHGDVQEPVLRATFEGSWDENWFGAPAVYDLDNNGSLEIIAGRHSVLYVYDAGGGLLWRAAWGEDGVQEEVHGSSRIYPSVVAGDFDGDTLGEIAGCTSNHIYVYGHDGSVLRRWSFGDSEIRSLAAADLDRDGTMEMLAVKTSDGPATAVFDYDGDMRAGWPQVDHDMCDPCYDYGGYNQNIGAGDLDGNGTLEVISTCDCCHFAVFHHDGAPVAVDGSYADAGPWFASVPLFHDIELARRGWGEDGSDRDELTDSPPVITDLDGDGDNEIILASDHELAGEYVNRGNSFWVFNNDMTRPAGWEMPRTSGGPLYTGYESNIVQVAPAASVGDFNGAEGKEIIAPSYDGKFYAWSMAGELLFTTTFDEEGDPFIGASEALIVDLNGDGSPELIFNTYSVDEGVSELVILSGNGNPIHAVPLSGRGNMGPPTIFDIDGDDDLEIIISLKDAEGGGKGGVQVWDVPGSSTNCMIWPTARANFLRTGNP
ncbi:MAG: FG-GAP-like repeat-containing protein [Pseudomonadota bacterium]